MSNLDPLNDDYSPSTQPASAAQSVTSTAVSSPAQPEATEGYKAPEFDSAGLLDAQVNDINTLTAGDSNLMRGADARAKQQANDRGLLNSSMAVGAAESSRLDTVMPLVQNNAQTRGQATLNDRQNSFTEFQQNDDQAFKAGERALDRTHDITMQDDDQSFKMDFMDQEFQGKENLINIEQAWNSFMSDNKNAADFYIQSQQAIGEILSSDLTQEQLDSALNEMLGYNRPDGTHVPGSIEAGLNYLQSLSGFTPGSDGFTSSGNGGQDFSGAGSAPAAGGPGLLNGTSTDPMGGNRDYAAGSELNGDDININYETPVTNWDSNSNFNTAAEDWAGNTHVTFQTDENGNQVLDGDGNPIPVAPPAGPDVTDGYNQAAVENFDYSQYENLTPTAIQFAAFQYAQKNQYYDLAALQKDYLNNPQVHKAILDQAAEVSHGDQQVLVDFYERQSGFDASTLGKNYNVFSGTVMNATGASGPESGSDVDWSQQTSQAQAYYDRMNASR